MNKLRIGPASRKLGMSAQTLTRWRKKGLVKAERVGENGHWVFDLQDNAVACSSGEVEESTEMWKLYRRLCPDALHACVFLHTRAKVEHRTICEC
jgi:predicted site-specific integrase-resolvase